MFATRRAHLSGAELVLVFLWIAGLPLSGCRRAEPPPQEEPARAPISTESGAALAARPAVEPPATDLLPSADAPSQETADNPTTPREEAVAPDAAVPSDPTSGPTNDTDIGYDPTISPTAKAKVLADEGTPAAYLELIRLINNLPDGLERREALVAATRLDDPATAALLFETVRVSGEPELVQSAQMSLGGMTNAGVVWLAVALYRGTEDSAQQDRLLGVLRHGRQSSHVEALISVAEQLAGDPSDPLVRAVLDTLGVIGSPESIAYLVGQLNSAAQTGQDTTMPAAALGRVVKPEALPMLTALVAGSAPSTSMETRIAAARALGHYPWDAVEETLSAIVRNEKDSRLINAAQEAMNLSMGQVPPDFSDSP